MLYDRRRQALVRALDQHFGPRAQVLGDSAGMHLVLRLDTGLDDAELLRRAAAEGVGLQSTRQYYLRTPRADEYLLGYASLSEPQIREGVRRLARALHP
jgi:GntR family transcriptional regulator/MocR family aminotransferase